jgi:hypothetical protein
MLLREGGGRYACAMCCPRRTRPQCCWNEPTGIFCLVSIDVEQPSHLRSLHPRSGCNSSAPPTQPNNSHRLERIRRPRRMTRTVQPLITKSRDSVLARAGEPSAAGFSTTRLECGSRVASCGLAPKGRLAFASCVSERFERCASIIL